MADMTGGNGGSNGGGQGKGGNGNAPSAPNGGRSSQTSNPSPNVSRTSPGQPQQAPANMAPNTARTQSPQGLQNTYMKIEGGIDPQAVKSLNDSLKLMSSMNERQTASSKEMSAAIQEMNKYLATMAGATDTTTRRFRTMQETVQSVVVELDDVKSQYSALLQLQRQLQFSSDKILIGKNKNESIHFLNQAISKTKELQKARDLDVRSVGQLDKTLKALERTLHAVETASDDAFDPKALKDMNEALADANENAAKLRRNFEQTDTDRVVRGVKRISNSLDDMFDNRISRLMQDNGIDKIFGKFKTAFGKDARQERKFDRMADKHAWDDWKVARKEEKTRRKAEKEAIKSRKLMETSGPQPTQKPLQPVKKTIKSAVRSTSKLNIPIKPLKAAQDMSQGGSSSTPHVQGGIGGNPTIQHVTIQKATIENLEGLGQGKSESPKIETPEIETRKSPEGEESDKRKRGEKKWRGGKKPKPAKNSKQIAREAAKAKRGLTDKVEAPSNTTQAAAEMAEKLASSTKKHMSLLSKLPGRHKILQKAMSHASVRAAQSMASGSLQPLAGAAGRGAASAAGGAAAKVAGSGIARGIGVGLNRVAGLVAAPLNIAGAVLSVRDKVARENKELNDALAGGGIHSSGVNFAQVRRTLTSSGISNSASRGIGMKENMEVMKAMMEGGRGLGFLNSPQSKYLLENALMTKSEAIKGQDKFGGGGLTGAMSSAARSLSGGKTATASDYNKERRVSQSTGTMGAIMKNANFYGKNVGMDKVQSVKLTLDLLEKYQMTTEQTGDFFIKIDKAMKTAQISSSKYLEIVDSINGGFDEFNNTMRTTSLMLDMIGRNAVYTGDRMKTLIGNLTQGPQQDIAHRAFTTIIAMKDEKFKQNTIKMHEDIANNSKKKLLDQANVANSQFRLEDGVTKDADGNITDITDMRKYEAKLRELSRNGKIDSGDAKAIQMQIDSYMKVSTHHRNQARRLREGNYIEHSSAEENFGRSPEGAITDNIQTIMTVTQAAKGASIADLMSSDDATRDAAWNNETLMNGLAKQFNKPMDQVRGLLDSLRAMTGQVQDAVIEKLGHVTDEGGTDGTIDKQIPALVTLARDLQAEGAVELQGKNLSTNEEALKALKQLAKENKLVGVLGKSNQFITSFQSNLSGFVEDIQKGEAEDAKGKADEVTNATRESADMVVDAIKTLGNNLISSLSDLGRVINPREWKNLRNKEGQYAEDKSSATEIQKSKDDSLRKEAMAWIEPLMGKTKTDQGMSEQVVKWREDLERINAKGGIMDKTDRDTFDAAVAGIREHLKSKDPKDTQTNAEKLGIKELDTSKVIYNAWETEKKNKEAADAIESEKRDAAAAELRREKRRKLDLERAEKMRIGAMNFAQTGNLEDIHKGLMDSEKNAAFREQQARYTEFRNGAGKNMSDLQAKEVYASRYLVQNALLTGLPEAKNAEQVKEGESIIQDRLKEATMQRYFGEGDGKGKYTFGAGTNQDTMMGQLVQMGQDRGYFKGATRTMRADGQVVYNITNNNVDATTTIKQDSKAPNKTGETAVRQQ